MRRRPIVAVTCSWVAGVSILSLFQMEDVWLALSAFGLLILGLGLLGKWSGKLIIVCLLALILSSGERLWLEQQKVSKIPDGTAYQTVVLNGYLSSKVEVDGDAVSFRLFTQSIQLMHSPTGRKLNEIVMVRIKLTEQSQQQLANKWRRGDLVDIAGELQLPGDASNFGAFDYRSYLNQRGIYWQLSVRGLEGVIVKEGKSSLSVKGLRQLDQFRDQISALMDRMYLKGDSGYMKGLVVGIRSDLNPQQFDDFAKLGLTHVLAISGLHVGVIVFLLLQLGTLLRLTRERNLELTIAFMPVYMLITGASPSAVRACLMAMLALGLARQHALKDGLHLLCAAALVMLMWNPALVEEVSFQLSFIVTAGLLLFVPAITEALPLRWKWLKSAASVTMTAQMVSFPLTAYYFHSVHLLSLPANFLLVPFISFIVMPLGMASIVLGAMWLPLGIIPARLASMGNQLTFAVIDKLSSYSALRTVWPQPSLLWVATAFVLMGAGMFLLRKNLAYKQEQEWWTKQTATIPEGNTGSLAFMPPELKRSKGSMLFYSLLLSIAVIGWLLWGYKPELLDRSAAVSFFNVGQGDSVLIRSGRGKYVLIDTGGTVSFRKPGEEWRERGDPYEVGRKLLVPLLLARGVRELDALVLTHMDADHIGGASAILDQIPVRSVLFNGTIKNSAAVTSLLQQALDKGIQCYAVHAPLVWKLDSSVELQALYPLEAGGITTSNEQNDSSVVLLVTLYGRQFLLPGDLEAKGELKVVEAQIKAGYTARRYVDVLKAGHHGSKTSTTQAWLTYWQPREAVISVGLNNVYGHPHPTVMDRLTSPQRLILRTDLNGEIQYRIAPDGSMVRRVLYQS